MRKKWGSVQKVNLLCYKIVFDQKRRRYDSQIQYMAPYSIMFIETNCEGHLGEQQEKF